MYFNHRVLLVLVSSLIACGGDSSTPLGDGGQDVPVPPAGSVTVNIQDFSFAPQTVTVKAGTTVHWINQGPSVHTTVSDAPLWDSGPLDAPSGGGGYGGGGTSSGASFDFTFTAPGTYAYHCRLHPVSSYPNFTGTVIVNP